MGKIVATIREEVELPDCPKCGSNAVYIVEHPRPGKRWWGGFGAAECEVCGLRFQIREATE